MLTKKLRYALWIGTAMLSVSGCTNTPQPILDAGDKAVNVLEKASLKVGGLFGSIDGTNEPVELPFNADLAPASTPAPAPVQSSAAPAQDGLVGQVTPLTEEPIFERQGDGTQPLVSSGDSTTVAQADAEAAPEGVVIEVAKKAEVAPQAPQCPADYLVIDDPRKCSADSMCIHTSAGLTCMLASSASR
ncbi:MAG: hypothetical protein HWE20_05675 [Gammaproteobacteria bacterium]|nr:hypothetical protein [Gammaproteobacteria bacterium]